MGSARTVFMDNLSDSTRLRNLWTVFQPFGRILNIHQPQKRRIVNNTIYAFVSFEKTEDANIAIQKTNGLLLDGNCISTQPAKPLRASNQAWKPKLVPIGQSQSSPIPNQAGVSSLLLNLDESEWPSLNNKSGALNPPAQGRLIHLCPSDVLIPVLARSAVLKTRNESKHKEASKYMELSGVVEHIIFISELESILVFKDTIKRDRFIEGKKWQDEEWKVEEWSEKETGESRIANVLIRGLPPQAWSRGSIQSVLEGVDEIVSINSDMDVLPVSLDVSATISTKAHKLVNEEFEALFDSKLVRIAIVEIINNQAAEPGRLTLSAAAEQSPGEGEKSPTEMPVQIPVFREKHESLCDSATVSAVAPPRTQFPEVAQQICFPSSNHVIRGDFSLLSLCFETPSATEGAASKYLLTTYTKSFYGFAALLTEDEATAIFHKEGVVSVFPNRKNELHTTRSWDFLRLPLEATRNPQVENDIIVGVIDTGIWPESLSFNDSGFGPIPARWKGGCDSSYDFSCNSKIIGAQCFRTESELLGNNDELSPRDTHGHGTFTASIAAGSVVYSANSFGLATGTARGGVPSARIAVYKVCWSNRCYDADILSAFDAAIADGVDMVSISMASDTVAKNYFDNPIAIGSFHAMQKGILTSASAGNNGSEIFTIPNVAPWLLTVAASTIDREFSTKVVLGNNMSFKGISLNPFELNTLPLIYGRDAQNPSSLLDASFCGEGSLDPTKVSGKIVLCDSLSSGGGPLKAGAKGMLRANVSTRDDPRVFPLPVAEIDLNDDIKTLDYLHSHPSATATIYKTNEEKDTSAPLVASFSSRGPNAISPGILKPDISAPGVAILAGWSPRAPPSIFPGDPRHASYNIQSGSSVACPHATGVAAYVKSFNPDWSPSAIKSAIMTTATKMKNPIHGDAEFGYGAGQINPVAARDPGLIYDAGENDYINFLCGEGIDITIIRKITGDGNVTCPDTINGATGFDLNYPSFAHQVHNSGTFDITFSRTVTNVGPAVSTYKLKEQMKPNLARGQFDIMKVVPDTLYFTTLRQNRSFTVTINGSVSPNSVMSTQLVWDDGTHRVRIPIVFFNLHD